MVMSIRLLYIYDGDLLKYVVEGGAYFREHFFGKYPETLELVSHMSDDELIKMKLGGHDPVKMYASHQKRWKKKTLKNIGNNRHDKTRLEYIDHQATPSGIWRIFLGNVIKL